MNGEKQLFLLIAVKFKKKTLIFSLWSKQCIVLLTCTFYECLVISRIFATYYVDFRALYIIITFFVIWPTSIGAKNPAVFAKQLVIPIKVPEKFGAISIWLQLIDINEAPLKPTQTHRRATTAYLWQPAYRIKINANAGIIKAEKKIQNLGITKTRNWKKQHYT